MYGFKQASRSWHVHLVTRMKSLGFERCLADACLFRLVENGKVSIMAVVHVDNIFAAGCKSRFDQQCEELKDHVPINNLGDLTCYGGCHYSRDKEAVY